MFVATQAAVAKRDATRWTPDTELAAMQVEVVHMLFRAFVQANSKKGTTPPEPLHVPRPYEKPQEAVTMRSDEVARLLAGGAL